MSDLVTHRWATHHCVGGSNPDACERSLTSHAVYTLIQCTPLFVEKVGVTPEVNLRNLLCSGEEASKWGNPPWFEMQGRHYQKSKTGVSVAPRKGHASYKHFIKKKKINWPRVEVLEDLWCTLVGEVDAAEQNDILPLVVMEVVEQMALALELDSPCDGWVCPRWLGRYTFLGAILSLLPTTVLPSTDFSHSFLYDLKNFNEI